MPDDDEGNPLFSNARGRYYDPDGSIARALEEGKPIIDTIDALMRRLDRKQNSDE